MKLFPAIIGEIISFLIKVAVLGALVAAGFWIFRQGYSLMETGKEGMYQMRQSDRMAIDAASTPKNP